MRPPRPAVFAPPSPAQNAPSISRRHWLALAALGASASVLPAWAATPPVPADIPDEALRARLVDRITWGSTAQGAQALAVVGIGHLLAEAGYHHQHPGAGHAGAEAQQQVAPEPVCGP